MKNEKNSHFNKYVQQGNVLLWRNQFTKVIAVRLTTAAIVMTEKWELKKKGNTWIYYTPGSWMLPRRFWMQQSERDVKYQENDGPRSGIIMLQSSQSELTNSTLREIVNAYNGYLSIAQSRFYCTPWSCHGNETNSGSQNRNNDSCRQKTLIL